MTRALIGASPITDMYLVGYTDDERSTGETEQAVVFRASGNWCILGLAPEDAPNKGALVPYKMPAWLGGMLTQRLESSGVDLPKPPAQQSQEDDHTPQIERRGRPGI